MTDLTAITEQLKAMQSQIAESVKEFQPKLPEVKFNRNGYEIRSEVLGLAKDFTEYEFSSKWMGFETSAKRDPETGQIVNKVDMPEVPGVEQVLETAERFYEFINKK